MSGMSALKSSLGVNPTPMDLPPLTTGVLSLPDRILVYGPPGTGKTTFAAGFPAPIFLDLEGGTHKLKGISRDEPKSYRWLVARLESDLSAFHTVIIDTIDRLEQMIQQHLCEVNGWASIETPGYGKGYDKAVECLVELLGVTLGNLRAAGKTIILIGHTNATTVPNPAGDDYTIYGLTAKKKFASCITDWCDVIALTEREAKVSEDDKITLSGRLMLRLHPDGCLSKARTEEDITTPKLIEMPRANPAKPFLDWRTGATPPAPATRVVQKPKKAAPAPATAPAEAAPVASDPAADYQAAMQLLALCDDADGKKKAYIEANKDNPSALQKAIAGMNKLIQEKGN